MHNTIIATAALTLTALTAQAQFNTVSSRGYYGLEIKAMKVQSTYNKLIEADSLINDTQIRQFRETGIPVEAEAATDRKRNENKSDLETVKSPVQYAENDKLVVSADSELPELTIPNLLAEIKKNGIRHSKIVLAQAILETGWFRSSVCRNKHNLFGLTNPRTGQYYEFNHWTESVRAFYTKVQYRYNGGNYLLWLRDIGYAEDKGYIRAVIRVLRQL